MTDSITPPPELVREWASESLATQNLCDRAAQWGANQELEACCEWVAVESIAAATELRAARRPKSPSLKEQALGILDVAHHDVLEDDQIATIRRALKALPE